MKKTAWAILILFALSWLATAADTQEIQPLSLEDAIVKALKNNLDLQIAMANPDISQQLLSKSRSLFVPQLTLNYRRNQTNQPTTSAIEGGTVVTNKLDSLNLALSQKIALGGTLQVQFANSRTFNTSLFSSYNPYYNSGLNFSLTQPLLKNFGTSVTKYNIYVAINNEQQSVFALRQNIIDLIYSVEQAYWDLVYAYQNLGVQQKSVQLARDLLKQNEAQVRVGVSAPMDILTAQAEVAARESDLLSAQNTVEIMDKNLRVILNLNELKAKLNPTDMPIFRAVETDFNGFLLEALDKRPDIQQVRLDLKNKNLGVRYTRNQLLPQLDLTAQYYTSGISGDKLIFNGNPLFGGTVIGVIKGDIGQAMKDVLASVYRNYTLALQLSVPLKNDSARADYAQAQLALKQSLLQLKKTESTIFSDVKQIVTDLEYSKKQVEATRISRELQEQKLQAEQKKLAVGLSTNYLVLQYQRDFATAQVAELNAIIINNLAFSRLSKVLGTTLEKHQIEFSNFLPQR